MAHIIYQNISDGSIADLAYTKNYSLSDLKTEENRVFVDCDEDSVLVQSPHPPQKKNLSEIRVMPEFSDPDFLIPAVSVDRSGIVLMQAFVNRESLSLCLKTGFAHYYSRSRNKLWKKGEDSGHLQKILSITGPDDCSFFVFLSEQVFGACHTGYYSCFYREYSGKDSFKTVYSEKSFDPEKVYRGA